MKKNKRERERERERDRDRDRERSILSLNHKFILSVGREAVLFSGVASRKHAY